MRSSMRKTEEGYMDSKSKAFDRRSFLKGAVLAGAADSVLPPQPARRPMHITAISTRESVLFIFR